MEQANLELLPKPPFDQLLFSPAPEGYRGLAISTRLLTWSVPWTLLGSTAGLLPATPGSGLSG